MRNVCFFNVLKPALTVSSSKHMAFSLTSPSTTTKARCSLSRVIIPFLHSFRQYNAAAAAVAAVHSPLNVNASTTRHQFRDSNKKTQSPATTMDTHTNKVANIPYDTRRSPVRPAQASIAITKLSRQGRSAEALSIFIKLLQKSETVRGSADWEFPSHEALYSLAHTLYKDQDLRSLLLIRDTLLQRFLSPHSWHQIQQQQHHCSRHNFKNSVSIQQPVYLCSRKEAKATLYIYTMIFNLLARKSNPSLYQIRMLCYELSLLPVKEPTVPYYNTLISLLLQRHHRKQAFAVYQELLKRSKPSIVTYTILMNDAAHRGRYKKMMEYLDQVDKHKLKMDYGIASVVVKALCQTGQFELAETVALQLERQRLAYQQLQQQQFKKKNDEQDPLCTKSFKQSLLRLIEKRRRRWQKGELLKRASNCCSSDMKQHNSILPVHEQVQ